jgi:hypothetical protein
MEKKVQNVGQPKPKPQLQPQLELEAKEAINFIELLFFSNHKID